MNIGFRRSPIIPLSRPQYVSTPEAFISALAWKEFDVDLTGKTSKPQALRYSQSSPSSSKVMEVRTVKPEIGALGTFAAKLQSEGFNSVDPHALARSILESVGGVRVEKSGVQPASPLTPSIALAQNTRGLQGAANPPDIAEILETMFEMGCEPDKRTTSVSGLWKRAAFKRLELDPLLRRIDRSFDSVLLDKQRSDRGRAQGAGQPDIPYFGGSTPYAWFHQSWSKLTSDEWVAALPARVWVDWATTITRMTFGMGFLWESVWYDAIAREALRETSSPNVIGRVEQQPLLVWRPETNSVSVRDVAPILKWRVHRGVQIRAILEKFKFDSEDVHSQVLELKENEQALQDLTAAVQSNRPTGPGKNAWEAVRYALRTRETASDAADYYGLLTSRARYLVPSPGTEWMAVIASLSVESPGHKTEVATVMRDLRRLGLRPELGSLIKLLERSGLARGSADADQGVVVQSAF